MMMRMINDVYHDDHHQHHYHLSLSLGETGCGKSTQVPQFIYEHNPNGKIVICQPRRLAATGVALRVAEEMDTSIGDVVGYMVKGDSKSSKNTKIVFCTYGVMLRRLQV